MSALLKLDAVEMHFRARAQLFQTTVVKALDGVSLSLDPGETLAIVGESGSGKTTLGRVSLRLLEPTAGQVYFDGKDVTTASEGDLKDLRRRAQGVFQDPFTSLDPYMTIRQIVEEPLVIHDMGSSSERSERVAWALEEVRLRPASDFLDRYTHMLSGGQRQRIGIARALVITPDYILADEPVSMIDASSRAEILVLLRELQERHRIAYLYVTHDIATARHYHMQRRFRRHRNLRRWCMHRRRRCRHRHRRHRRGRPPLASLHHRHRGHRRHRCHRCPRRHPSRLHRLRLQRHLRHRRLW